RTVNMCVAVYVEWKSRQIRTFYVNFCPQGQEVYCKLEYMERHRKGNWYEARCQEKRRSNVVRCPYRKPTQVDEERILRRPDQCSLRNSAKKQVYLRYIP